MNWWPKCREICFLTVKNGKRVCPGVSASSVKVFLKMQPCIYFNLQKHIFATCYARNFQLYPKIKIMQFPFTKQYPPSTVITRGGVSWILHGIEEVLYLLLGFRSNFCRLTFFGEKETDTSVLLQLSLKGQALGQ